MARKAKAAKAVKSNRGRKPLPRDAQGNIIRPGEPVERKTAKTRADAPGVARARARTKVSEEAAPAVGDNKPPLSVAQRKELHDQHLESAIKVDRRVKDAGAAQRALGKQVKADLGPFAWAFLQAEVRAAKDAEEWQAFADKINAYIELARVVGRKLPGLEFSRAVPAPSKPLPVKGPPATTKTINQAYREGEAAAARGGDRVVPEKYDPTSVFADSWLAGYSAGIAKRPTTADAMAQAMEAAPRPPHHVDHAAHGEEHEEGKGEEGLNNGQYGYGNGEDVSQVQATDDFDGGFETAA
jgi:hypothetical protein